MTSASILRNYKIVNENQNKEKKGNNKDQDRNQEHR